MLNIHKQDFRLYLLSVIYLNAQFFYIVFSSVSHIDLLIYSFSIYNLPPYLKITGFS